MSPVAAGLIWEYSSYCKKAIRFPYVEDAEDRCVRCYAHKNMHECGLDTNTEISEHIKGLRNDYLLLTEPSLKAFVINSQV